MQNNTLNKLFNKTLGNKLRSKSWLLLLKFRFVKIFLFRMLFNLISLTQFYECNTKTYTKETIGQFLVSFITFN